MFDGADERPASADMVTGYLDGRDSDCPAPNANRSESYRHGFENGRREIENRKGPTAQVLREQADCAMREDDRRGMS